MTAFLCLEIAFRPTYGKIRKSNDLREDKWRTSDGYTFHLVRNHSLEAQDFLKKVHLNDFKIELDE
jgi:hypothetical protein